MKREMESRFDQLMKNYQKEVLRATLLPIGAFNARSFSGGTTEIIPIKCEVPSTNHLLSGSKYYYTVKKEFVHYTSLKAVVGILREKGIRMYNLKNVSDPKEFDFGVNATKVNNSQINKAKDNTYVFSMSMLHPEHKENPVLWRLYGNNGFGCALVIEIINDLGKWQNYHLSKVYYNEKEDIDEFYKKSIEFEKNNSVRIEYDLTRLIAFHKDKIWKIEDEIRILALFQNFGEYDKSNKNVFFDVNRINEKVSYNLLSLVGHSDEKNDRDFIKTYPHVKIKEIIIGYNVSNFDKIKKTLRDLLRESLKYPVKISQSVFYGKM